MSIKEGNERPYVAIKEKVGDQYVLLHTITANVIFDSPGKTSIEAIESDIKNSSIPKEKIEEIVDLINNPRKYIISKKPK